MPVTFGGGITMQYGSLPRAAAEWKYPFCFHQAYQWASME
jgi:hypothetical protein